MPEVTHTAIEHRFVEDGRRSCGPGCQLVVEACACGLQRRLRVIDGTIRNVDVKVPGGWEWLDLVQLLRVELPYLLCPRCSGSGCDTCKRIGVLERIPPRSASTGAGSSGGRP